MSNEAPRQSLSRQQALSKIDEAQKLFDSVRPVRDDIEVFEAFSGKIMTIVAFTVVGAIAGVALFAVGSPLVFSTIVLSLVGFSLVSLLLIDSENYLGHPHQRVRNVLSYLFFDKAQREWFRQYQSNAVAYRRANEMHKLLVVRGISELENKGVFEVVNDLSNPDISRVTYIDPSTGYVRYTDRVVFEENQRKKLACSSELVSKAIFDKLTDGEELFG